MLEGFWYLKMVGVPDFSYRYRWTFLSVEINLGMKKLETAGARPAKNVLTFFHKGPNFYIHST